MCFSFSYSFTTQTLVRAEVSFPEMFVYLCNFNDTMCECDTILLLCKTHIQKHVLVLGCVYNTADDVYTELLYINSVRKEKSGFSDKW